MELLAFHHRRLPSCCASFSSSSQHPHQWHRRRLLHRHQQLPLPAVVLSSVSMLPWQLPSPLHGQPSQRLPFRLVLPSAQQLPLFQQLKRMLIMKPNQPIERKFLIPLFTIRSHPPWYSPDFFGRLGFFFFFCSSPAFSAAFSLRTFRWQDPVAQHCSTIFQNTSTDLMHYARKYFGIFFCFTRIT